MATMRSTTALIKTMYPSIWQWQNIDHQIITYWYNDKKLTPGEFLLSIVDIKSCERCYTSILGCIQICNNSIKCMNWIRIKRRKLRKKRRKNSYYGYCMLLTNAAFDVRAHLSGREVSTGPFLPVTKWEQDWRTSSDFSSISDQCINDYMCIIKKSIHP